MAIKIITDSASDILQSEAKELGIEILPLKTIFDKEEYLDGVNLSHEQFYEKLTTSGIFPRTSQINPFDYDACFKRYSKDDELIVITISSFVSGCYQSACIASQDYPNVRIIDSLNMSVGEQMLVRYAIRLLKEGKTSKEIEDILNKEKHDIVVVAVLDTLEFLRKGGRISSAQAFFGNLLSIKPVIGIKEGKVLMLGKARGSKNGNNILRKLVKESGGIDFTRPYATAYSGCDDTNLRKYIEDSKDLYDCDMKDIPISTIGSTIGTHSGPGAFGVAYYKGNSVEE